MEGIGGNVDSGNWDKLSQDQRLDGYDHLFLRWTTTDVFAGRMWSSTDGKGRTRYPMIVCAQCSRLPLSWILQNVLPRLEHIKKQCLRATAASTVRSIISDVRDDLRQLAQYVGRSRHELEIPATPLAELADNPAMGEDHIGLLRILYSIGESAPGNDTSNGDTSGRVGRVRFHMRVPACAASPVEAIRLWLGFLRGEFEEPANFMLLFPLGESWLDIVIGEPTAKELYCIGVSLEGIPPTAEIPYTLDEGFVDRAEQRIIASREERGG
jgi:hypothetical protein